MTNNLSVGRILFIELASQSTTMRQPMMPVDHYEAANSDNRSPCGSQWCQSITMRQPMMPIDHHAAANNANLSPCGSQWCQFITMRQPMMTIDQHAAANDVIECECVYHCNDTPLRHSLAILIFIKVKILSALTYRLG